MSSENVQAALGFFQSRFTIDQKIMNDLLGVALSRGGDFAELYFEHRQTSMPGSLLSLCSLKNLRF
jgi:hypothetical protein